MDELRPGLDPQPVPAPPLPRRSPIPATPLFPGASSPATTPFLGKSLEGIAPRESPSELSVLSKEGFVPADVANQKLWRVTTEYENLLAMQKEHQGLVARRREAELTHLRAVAAMLAGQDGDEENAAAVRLRAQEEEAALTMQAKQAELALLGAVLALRDRQANDLRDMCEAKRARIRHLQSGGPLEKVTGDSWADVERLRSQASQLEVAVTDKQNELRSLAITLEDRTRRAADLQAEVAEAERELCVLAGATVVDAPDMIPDAEPQAAAIAHSAASQTAPSPSRAGLEALPAQSRPQGTLQARVEATRAQLAEAQQALGNMVRNNAHNDRLVREMRGAVSVSELGTSYENDTLPESSFVAASNVAQSDVSELIGSPTTSPTTLPVASPTASPTTLPSPPTTSGRISVTPPASPPRASTAAPPTPAPAPPVPVTPVVFDVVEELPLVDQGLDAKPSPPSPRLEIDEPWHAYKPHPGDPIDAKVAQFVNQPRNRLRRALFCRLSAGEYLYGTRHAQLRLCQNADNVQLEAREASPQEVEPAKDHTGDRSADCRTWTPVEEFARDRKSVV